MKAWLVTAGIVVIAGLALFGYAHLRTDTYLGRWFAWRASDVGDMHRFPALPIAASTAPRPLVHAPDEGGLLERQLEASSRGAGPTRTVGELLSATDTTAFVVLRDGQVVLEWYAAGSPASARDQAVTTFSVSKSVTSMLVGAALADGLIFSLDDPITRYLPEYRDVDPGYERVTIRHLLVMRSGIRFRDHDLPWGDKARVYYEPHLRDLARRLPLATPAGGEFRYNSYNPVVLGLLLERATRGGLEEYAQRRLWGPLGAEYPASWSVSAPGETLPKMESGFNARPIDLVRLGQLLLDGGVVDGRQVVPRAWTESIMAPQPGDLIDPGSGLHYSLGWWVYAPTDGRPHALAAQGHLGQYIFVYPEERVVIARFGTSEGGVASWRGVFDQLARAAAEDGAQRAVPRGDCSRGQRPVLGSPFREQLGPYLRAAAGPGRRGLGGSAAGGHGLDR